MKIQLKGECNFKLLSKSDNTQSLFRDITLRVAGYSSALCIAHSGSLINFKEDLL